MKYPGPLFLLLALAILCPVSKAQQSTMTTTTGLGPGNSFTMFITFQNPMRNVQGISCVFQLQGTAKPGQGDFVKTLTCSGGPIKDDDQHYRIKVGDIPQDIAAGDYKLVWINVSLIGEAVHRYEGADLPTLAAVSVSNPKRLEFSPIKNLETKP